MASDAAPSSPASSTPSASSVSTPPTPPADDPLALAAGSGLASLVVIASSTRSFIYEATPSVDEKEEQGVEKLLASYDAYKRRRKPKLEHRRKPTNLLASDDAYKHHRKPTISHRSSSFPTDGVAS